MLHRIDPLIYSNVIAAEGYEDTLDELIKITYDCVCEYLDDASVVTAIAQKANASVNIKASIACVVFFHF